MRWALFFGLLGCTGTLSEVGVDPPRRDGAADGGLDAPAFDAPGFDAPGTDAPGLDVGTDADVPPPTGRAPSIPIAGSRPVDIMSRDRLTKVAARAPRIDDAWLLGVLEADDTMWYDHDSIAPGYQDSFGDNVVTPIGMRPNTIDPGLINLAVPGGHGQIFVEFGVFHFPFGRPAGSREDVLRVADFWRLPRDESGRVLPVVHWQRDPNSITHRVEWMFPVGTVLGELLFQVDASGEWFPFEIRTRVRRIDGWSSNVFRPFPTAEDFARELERRRTERPEWATSEIDALIAHARNSDTLRSARLSATNFPGAFPAIDGAEDVLPELSDDSILRTLLMETPFRSAIGAVWKEGAGMRTYAPTSDARFSIVPRGYNGGFLDVSDATCNRCHRDAGRPFRDWYDNIIAYGELWGEDESFSWHPFETRSFVDETGRVVQFNYDNRRMRSDFVDGGVLVPYDSATHREPTYRTLPGSWKDYAY